MPDILWTSIYSSCPFTLLLLYMTKSQTDAMNTRPILPSKNVIYLMQHEDEKSD